MILGTAGHVDHGKTTLVHALTGVDCDRLDEEQRRGITIALGYAPWTLPDERVVSVIDVPGHERLVRTMLVGAGGMEAVLLVVSAEAGVMPQTREHLGACQVLGALRGAVAVTFTDRVDDLDTSLELIRADLEGTALETAPLLPVCAPDGQGLDALTAEVARLVDAYTPPPDDLPAVLPVDRVFTVSGFGTVVTGSLLRGRLTVGDTVALHPGPARVRIRGLQVHGADVETTGPGRRVAVNLADVSRADVLPGAIVAPPGSLLPTRVVDAEVEWLAQAERPLRRRRGLGFHVGAARALADVRADTPIEPGERGTARLRLDREVPVPPGARFVLRGVPNVAFGGVRGGGLVLDTSPPRRRRATVRTALAAHPRALDALVAESRRHGLQPGDVARRLPVPALPEGPLLFAPAVTAAALEELLKQVERWHRAHPLDPGMPAAQAGDDPLQIRALASGLEARKLERREDRLSLPTHRITLDDDGHALSGKLMRAIGRAGLQGPAEKELLERFPAPNARIREVLEFLERGGRVVRAQGYCFPGREASLLCRDAARDALEAPLTVGWLKARAGVTRKHAIPLFNWLDSTGATARRGNERVAGAKARELAATPDPPELQ